MDPANGILIEDFFVQHPTLALLILIVSIPVAFGSLTLKKKSLLPFSDTCELVAQGPWSIIHRRADSSHPLMSIPASSERLSMDYRQETSIPFTLIMARPSKVQELPFWEQVKALAESCLASFPRLCFAGLDIAISPTGPVVVELNVQPKSGRVLPR